MELTDRNSVDVESIKEVLDALLLSNLHAIALSQLDEALREVRAHLAKTSAIVSTTWAWRFKIACS